MTEKETPSFKRKHTFSKLQGRILIIDDTLENQEVLSRRLEREGHYPTTASSGKEALQILEKESFDLILCDLVMPHMNGMEFLLLLKENSLYRDIPVIMMSVLDDIEAIAHSIEAGAEDYLPKPFNPTLLKARIGACLEKKAFRDREKRYLQLLHQELSAAAKLQKSILPPPLEKEALTLSPLLKPASEVGGDFYDYFWLNDHQLSFIIADVSGKGLTGALFMAISRTLLKALASFSPDPAQCLKEVNKILCQDNETMMFVTAVYGILDITNYQITYVNAGHLSPLHLSSQKALFLPLLNPANPPLGVLEEAVFKAQTLILSPGEKLLLYTDGISEACNPQGNLFGNQRFLSLLESLRKEKTTHILSAIEKEIAHFAQETPQSDDITLLLVERTSVPSSSSLRLLIPNSLDEIPSLQDQIRAFLSQWSVCEKKIYHLLLILDELVSNIILHGYRDLNPHSIFLRISFVNQQIRVTLVDDGIPFNPLSKREPILSNSLEKREVGGLGIHFVKTFAHTMRYRRNKGLNYVWLLLEKAS